MLLDLGKLARKRFIDWGLTKKYGVPNVLVLNLNKIKEEFSYRGVHSIFLQLSWDRIEPEPIYEDLTICFVCSEGATVFIGTYSIKNNKVLHLVAAPYLVFHDLFIN